MANPSTRNLHPHAANDKPDVGFVNYGSPDICHDDIDTIHTATPYKGKPPPLPGTISEVADGGVEMASPGGAALCREEGSETEEDEEGECGYGQCHPQGLQICNNPKLLLACLCWFGAIQGNFGVRDF